MYSLEALQFFVHLPADCNDGDNPSVDNVGVVCDLGSDGRYIVYKQQTGRAEWEPSTEGAIEFSKITKGKPHTVAIAGTRILDLTLVQFKAGAVLLVPEGFAGCTPKFQYSTC